MLITLLVLIIMVEYGWKRTPVSNTNTCCDYAFLFTFTLY